MYVNSVSTGSSCTCTSCNKFHNSTLKNLKLQQISIWQTTPLRLSPYEVLDQFKLSHSGRFQLCICSAHSSNPWTFILGWRSKPQWATLPSGLNTVRVCLVARKAYSFTCNDSTHEDWINWWVVAGDAGCHLLKSGASTSLWLLWLLGDYQIAHVCMEDGDLSANTH